MGQIQLRKMQTLQTDCAYDTEDLKQLETAARFQKAVRNKFETSQRSTDRVDQ